MKKKKFFQLRNKEVNVMLKMKIAVVVLVCSASLVSISAYSKNSCDLLGIKQGETIQLDEVNGKSLPGGATQVVISGNGRYITFASDSKAIQATTLSDPSTLVKPNGYKQIYLTDLKTKSTILASISSDGQPANADCSLQEASIDKVGAVVVFQSAATNLVANASNNSAKQVYVFYRKASDKTSAGALVLVSRTSSGNPAQGGDSSVASVSADGKFVVYKSNAKSIVPGVGSSQGTQIIRFNLETLESILVSKNKAGDMANGTTGTPSISGTGRFVTWPSDATNLVSESSQKEHFYNFRKDMKTQEIIRFSPPFKQPSIIPKGYCEGNALQTMQCGSFSPDTAKDGTLVVFDSIVSNLDPDTIDSNSEFDAFLYNAKTKKIIALSQSDGKTFKGGLSDAPDVSGNGKAVIYRSFAFSPAGYFYTQLNKDGDDQKLTRASFGPNGQMLVVGSGTDGDMPNLTDDGTLAVFYARYTKGGENHIFARCVK